MEVLYILNHWHWWALAALLVVGEILAPCVYYLALGIAAALVGLVVRFLPGMGGQWQLGLFVVLAIIALLVAQRVRQRRTSTPSSAAKHD
jgi:membrane protein implicated in regulation of membrane protease activity